jgi:hypothetical protein
MIGAAKFAWNRAARPTQTFGILRIIMINMAARFVNSRGALGVFGVANQRRRISRHAEPPDLNR